MGYKVIWAHSTARSLRIAPAREEAKVMNSFLKNCLRFTSVFAICAAFATPLFADHGEDPLSFQPDLLADAPAVPDFSIENPAPLVWTDHKNHPERDLWTDYTYKVINTVFDQLDSV